MTWEGRLGHEPGRSRSVLASASVSSSVWVPAQSLVPVAQYYLTPLRRPICFNLAIAAALAVKDGLVDRDVRQVLLVLGFSTSPFQYR